MRAAASQTAPRGSTSLAASVTCVTTPAPPVWMQDLQAAPAVKMVRVAGVQMVGFYCYLQCLVHALLKFLYIVISSLRIACICLIKGEVKCPILDFSVVGGLGCLSSQT